MIIPICLYGCELWVPSLGKSKAKTSIEDRYDDFHCEKIFLSYCKQILGVNKYTTNDAVRGELGIYPLCLYAMCQSVKYLEHLTTVNDSSLLYHAFCELYNKGNLLKFGWLY